MYAACINNIGKLVSQSKEDIRLGSDDGTFRTVSTCLVLAGHYGHHPAFILYQKHLGMILRQVNIIENSTHESIQVNGLLGCLQVGHEDRMKYQAAFAK